MQGLGGKYVLSNDLEKAVSEKHKAAKKIQQI